MSIVTYYREIYGTIDTIAQHYSSNELLYYCSWDTSNNSANKSTVTDDSSIQQASIARYIIHVTLTVYCHVT